MIMLVLIHLDAYLYEAIHAFHGEWTEQASSTSAGTVIQEESSLVAEWGDLTYSRTSSRGGMVWMSVYLLPLLYFIYSFFAQIRQNLCYGGVNSVHLATRCHYVTYCTLLI